MNKYICILASAALLAACEQKTETAAPEASPAATAMPEMTPEMAPTATMTPEMTPAP